MHLNGYRASIQGPYRTNWFLTWLAEQLAHGFGQAATVVSVPNRKVLRASTQHGEFYIKIFRFSGIRERLKAALGSDNATKSFRAGCFLRKKVIATPAPVALLRRSISPLACEVILITEGVQGGRPVKLLLEDLLVDPRRKIDLIRSVAQFLAKLHDQGVYHGDFSAMNLIAQPDPAAQAGFCIYLIDLDSIRSLRWISRRRRIKNLEELGRNFRNLRHVGIVDRLRFLVYYHAAASSWHASSHKLQRMVCQRTAARLAKYGQRFEA